MATTNPSIVGPKDDIILSDLKGHSPLAPTQTTQEGTLFLVPSTESRRVLRKIDMW